MSSSSPFLENVVKKIPITKELVGCLDEFEKQNKERLLAVKSVSVDPNQYSPFLPLPFLIYCGKNEEKKLLVGKYAFEEEPVVIDNLGLIHRFVVAKQPSASGRFYKVTVVGQGPEDIIEEGRVNLGDIFALAIDQFAIFYIYPQTDKQGQPVTESISLYNLSRESYVSYKVLGDSFKQGFIELVNKIYRFMSIPHDQMISDKTSFPAPIHPIPSLPTHALTDPMQDLLFKEVKKVAMLEFELDDYKKKFEAISKEKALLEEKVKTQESVSTHHSLLSQNIITQITVELGQKEKEIKEAKKELEELQKQLLKLQQDIKGQELLTKQVEGQKDRLLDKIEQIGQEKDDAVANVQRLNKNIHDKEEIIEKLKKENASLEEQLEQVKDSESQIMDGLRFKSHLLDEAESQLETLKMKLLALKNQFRQFKSDTEIQQAAHLMAKRELEELQNAKDDLIYLEETLKKQISDKDETIKNQQSVIKALEEAKTKRDKQNKELVLQLENLKEVNAKLLSEQEKLQINYQSLSLELESLTRKLSDQVVKEANLKKQLYKLSQDKEQIIKNAKSLKQNLDKTLEQMVGIVKSKKSVQEKLQNEEEKRQQLERQLHGLKAEIESSRIEGETTVAQYEALKKQYEELEKELIVNSNWIKQHQQDIELASEYKVRATSIAEELHFNRRKLRELSEEYHAAMQQLVNLKNEHQVSLDKLKHFETEVALYKDESETIKTEKKIWEERYGQLKPEHERISVEVQETRKMSEKLIKMLEEEKSNTSVSRKQLQDMAKTVSDIEEQQVLTADRFLQEKKLLEEENQNLEKKLAAASAELSRYQHLANDLRREKESLEDVKRKVAEVAKQLNKYRSLPSKEEKEQGKPEETESTSVDQAVLKVQLSTH